MARSPSTNMSMSPRRYANNADASIFLRLPRDIYCWSQSFTVTNVTLKPGTGYSVEFVNPANPSQVYATGPSFEVKAAGSKFTQCSF